MTLEWRLISERLSWWGLYRDGELLGRVVEYKRDGFWLAEWRTKAGAWGAWDVGTFATADEAKAAVEARAVGAL